VQQLVFTGGGQDFLGNDIETWAPPVDVQVICWQSSLIESITGYTSRVVSDIDMGTPPELAVSVRDRFLLPGETKPFEVVAIEDANHGFHQWHPGSIVKLKLVTG
jgi:pimeloyl-ACP methyl ester carboxylesterase